MQRIREALRRRRRARRFAALLAVPAALAGGYVTVALGAGRAASAVPTRVASLAIPAPGVAGGHFGASVAVSADGNTALIGAPFEAQAGRILFYTRDGSDWSQQGPPFDGTEVPGTCLEEGGAEPEACRYGYSVALSADGNTALVGLPGSEGFKGAAWVFTRSDGTWSRGPELQDSAESATAAFGRAIALSADGDEALIGGPLQDGGSGAVWVFTRSGEDWSQSAILTPGAGSHDVHFGRTVSVSADGATALVGAPYDEAQRGSAWVFTREDGTWGRNEPKLIAGEPTAGELFGRGVALSADGSTALVGAPRHAGGSGGAWVFTRGEGTFNRQGGALQATEEDGGAAELGRSVALTAAGNVALLGGFGPGKTAGSAIEFGRSGGSWSEANVSVPSGEGSERARYGNSVALSSTGETALVGAPFLPARTGGVWSLTEPLTESTPVEAPPSEPPVQTPKTTSTPTPKAGLGGVLGTIAEAPPAPVLDTSGNVEPVGGTVRVKLPGSKGWVSLDSLRNVPFGTLIDTRHGSVSVTTVGPTGQDQTITFFDGVFKLSSKGKGRVAAVLSGGSYAACPTARERVHRAHSALVRTSRHHTVRRLWASGHGSYTTKGSYAAGAVQGTKWLTEDRCDGTLIVVATDKVLVTNLLTGRRTMVRAGHRLFVAAG